MNKQAWMGELRLARWVALAAASVTLALCPALKAEVTVNEGEASEEAHHAEGGLAPLIVAGNSEGLALGLQYGMGSLAVRAALGFAPYVVTIDDNRDHAANDFEFLVGYQVNSDLVWYFAEPKPTSRLGMSVGHRYHSILQHGATLGFQGEAELSRHVWIMYMFALSVFPEGNARAREHLDRSGVDFNFPLGAGFQGGAGVGLRFPL